VGGRERVVCVSGVCVVSAAGGRGGVADVRGALKCSIRWGGLLNSIREQRCGRFATEGRAFPGPASCARSSAPVQSFFWCRCGRAVCPTGPQARSALRQGTSDK